MQGLFAENATPGQGLSLDNDASPIMPGEAPEVKTIRNLLEKESIDELKTRNTDKKVVSLKKGAIDKSKL